LNLLNPEEVRHDGQVNLYYDDPHDAGRFDLVLAI
jgi:hypothetical protein